MFTPYLTIGVITTVLVFLLFGDDRAKAFLVTYTIGYAAIMVYLAATE